MIRLLLVAIVCSDIPFRKKHPPIQFFQVVIASIPKFGLWTFPEFKKTSE